MEGGFVKQKADSGHRPGVSDPRHTITMFDFIQVIDYLVFSSRVATPFRAKIESDLPQYTGQFGSKRSGNV